MRGTREIAWQDLLRVDNDRTVDPRAPRELTQADLDEVDELLSGKDDELGEDSDFDDLLGDLDGLDEDEDGLAGDDGLGLDGGDGLGEEHAHEPHGAATGQADVVGRPRLTRRGAREEGMLDIFAPRHNAREIAKQLVLLEDHIINPPKHCPDCIRKHLITAEALGEEAISLDENGEFGALFGDAVTQIRDIARSWLGAGQDQKARLAVQQDVRKLRKNMLKLGFDSVLEGKAGAKFAGSDPKISDMQADLIELGYGPVSWTNAQGSEHEGWDVPDGVLGEGTKAAIRRANAVRKPSLVGEERYDVSPDLISWLKSEVARRRASRKAGHLERGDIGPDVAQLQNDLRAFLNPASGLLDRAARSLMDSPGTDFAYGKTVAEAVDRAQQLLRNPALKPGQVSARKDGGSVATLAFRQALRQKLGLTAPIEPAPQELRGWKPSLYERVTRDYYGDQALPAPAPLGPFVYVPLTLTLKRGMKGDDVYEFQRALIAAGFSISADGDFGPGTEAAVKSLQAVSFTSVTGEADPGTQGNLRDMLMGNYRQQGGGYRKAALPTPAGPVPPSRRQPSPVSGTLISAYLSGRRITRYTLTGQVLSTQFGLSAKQGEMADLIQAQFAARLGNLCTLSGVMGYSDEVCARAMNKLVLAAVVNALYESALNPMANNMSENSVGLFQLRVPGAGSGMTVAQRQDPMQNIARTTETLRGIWERWFKPLVAREVQGQGVPIGEWTAAFVLGFERPANGGAVAAIRAKTASEITAGGSIPSAPGATRPSSPPVALARPATTFPGLSAKPGLPRYLRTVDGGQITVVASPPPAADPRPEPSGSGFSIFLGLGVAAAAAAFVLGRSSQEEAPRDSSFTRWIS